MHVPISWLVNNTSYQLCSTLFRFFLENDKSLQNFLMATIMSRKTILTQTKNTVSLFQHSNLLIDNNHRFF